MIANASVRASRLAHFAFALLAFAGLASCGGGGVSPVVVDPERITILPGTAVLYSGLPTTFQISGGSGSYIVSSSNQAIVPVSGTSGSTLIVVPSPVSADTTVTLTVRDTGTIAPVDAILTVRPNTVANNITVTASGTQSGTCAPAVCSGGDAEVVATISQGGVPLAARGVRLSVVSGDFRFIVTAPGTTGELLATSIDVVTDEVGKARARIRVLADAPNQTAELQVTDLGDLAFQRTSFLIGQSTGSSPGFFVSPTTITFSGALIGLCSNNASALFYIFGGVPPYTILNSGGSAFITTDDVAFASGDSVGVRTTGQCASNFPIIVRDSAGHTTTVIVSNLQGTVAPATLTAAPTDVNIDTCGAQASFTVSGGLGSYFVSSGSSFYLVTISGHTVTVSRRRGPTAPTSLTTDVGVTDGQTSATVTVHDNTGGPPLPAPQPPPAVCP